HTRSKRDWSSDVCSSDLSIEEARALGVTKVLQGNLDPSILLTDWELIEARTKAILDQGMNDGNHVFNLGHGVTPDVQPDTLKRLTEFIHSYSYNIYSKRGAGNEKRKDWLTGDGVCHTI